MSNTLFSALLWTLCCFISANAQEEFIRGQLLDSKTGEPIAFATIRIKGYALGVVSNMDGGFKVPQKFQSYSDQLEISSMGYQKMGVLISSLYRYGVNTINLVPRIFELSEAVVTANKKRQLSARGIIRRALRAIPKNFPVSSFSMVGYYRDYQLKDSEYINLNEAILEIFDPGFDARDQENSETLIYEYRQNKDFKKDTIGQQAYNYRTGRKIIDKDVFLYDYGGNEFIILRIHDAIRNHSENSFSFVNRLQYDFLTNHHGYRKGKVSYLDDEALYVVHFEKNTRRHYAAGTLFIARRDFAIHKMEYSVYNKEPNKDKTKEKARTQLPILFKVVTEYRKTNGKMYLNYISFNNRFETRLSPELYIKEMGVNPLQKNFVLRFSEELSEIGVFDKNNYAFFYKREPIEIERIVLFGKEVWVFPKMKTEEDLKRFEEIYMFSKRRERIGKLLKFEVKNLLTSDGNKLNEAKSEVYNQFREFFVQRVRRSSLIPVDKQFMDKGRPIFEDQPIVPPANFEEYWMNTPLQKIKE